LPKNSTGKSSTNPWNADATGITSGNADHLFAPTLIFKLMNAPRDVDKALLEKFGLEQSPAKLEQLLAEVENFLKLAPPEPSIHTATQHDYPRPAAAWAGAASAVINRIHLHPGPPAVRSACPSFS